MTSLRSIGLAMVLTLPLAASGCAAAPPPDQGPFYVAPRQDRADQDGTAPELGQHGGRRMQQGGPSLPDRSGGGDALPGDSVPGGTGLQGGGSMSVGGGS